MSAPAEKGGSIPRLYETNPAGVLFLAKQYLNNNLYFYPSHQDHNAGWNGVGGGWGDLYPTNQPYVVVSQGSSLSDQPFIRAFVAAVAALQPDTQRRLLSTQMLMPVMQSLFRQNNRAVRHPEDYFTGAAHPPVFSMQNLDEERFVRAAHNLTAFATPPLVVLEVKSESSECQNGRDFFELPHVKDEKIADTPCVIARVFRGGAFRREMVVSARRSTDIGGRPLEFRWVLLQGDARRVTITPSNDGVGSQDLRRLASGDGIGGRTRVASRGHRRVRLQQPHLVRALVRHILHAAQRNAALSRRRPARRNLLRDRKSRSRLATLRQPALAHPGPEVVAAGPEPRREVDARSGAGGSRPRSSAARRMNWPGGRSTGAN